MAFCERNQQITDEFSQNGAGNVVHVFIGEKAENDTDTNN